MAILDRSESRGGARVRLLAVHTTEGTSYTAEGLRDASWWTGSSHAIADDSKLLTPAEGCVPYEGAAWTLRLGNKISENIEQVGWARWTRAEWLARPKLLDNTARWLADRSKARGIPLVKLSPADVAAGKSGVIGHVDWTLGMKDGTHTDPGPSYPWDVVLDKARSYASGTPTASPLTLLESDMWLYHDNKGNVWKATDFTLRWVGTPEAAELLRRSAGPAIEVTKGELGVIRAQIQDNCAGLTFELAKAAGDVDEAAIIAGLVPTITTALAGKVGASREEIAQLLKGITLKAS